MITKAFPFRFLFSICSFFLLHDQLSSQEVKISIQPRNSFQFELVSVYPDSFPLVSTIFKAENRIGEPLWLLDKNDFIVKENQEECKVLSLSRITDQKLIKVGLVVDHSGSMMEDYYQLFGSFNHDSIHKINRERIEFPEGYVPPIESAKKAVIEFIYFLDQEKDSVQIVGFSTYPDSIYPFSNDTLELRKQVDRMEASGGTALYDAIGLALEQLSRTNGIRVLIALTDGMDNYSKRHPYELIDSALKYEIPVYSIALGNAAIDTIKTISDTTGGTLFYTKSSTSLVDIYQKIAEKIMAVYELKHLSHNLSSADTSREFTIDFKIDSMQMISGEVRTTLPKEVISSLKAKEEAIRNREAQFRRYVTYGVVGLGVLLLLGGFTVYNRKRSKLLISNVYPNPVDDLVTIDYKVLNTIDCRLICVDVRLRKKVEVPISNLDSSIQVDISGLSRGVILCRIVDGSGRSSNAYRILKK